MTKVALGICTYQRPAYLEKCTKSIARNCASAIDYSFVYNDGSDPKLSGSYKRAYAPLTAIGGHITEAAENGGVAVAKNALLRSMLETDADWFILCEDDIKILSPLAVTRYISIAKDNGLPHLSFAHHGPANAQGPVDADADVEFYPHSIGAWCLYSRECIETVGLFDEAMVNAMEHVEWEMRAYLAGFSPNGGPHRFADAAGSWIWLEEFPGSIEKSSIRPRDDWASNIRNAMTYWRDNKPETYALLFGPGTQLHNYALGITGG